MAALSDMQLLSTGNLELLAQQVVEGFITGLHKSPFHGFSVEFAEHRLYNSGESTRHIDWKLFARTDKLFVKRYEEETNLRCQLVLDTSGSMYYPEQGLNKMRFSVYAIASLMQLMRKQRDASGLSLFDEQLNYHSESKVAVSHIRMLLGKLDELLKQPQKRNQANIAQALHGIAERQHRRSMVIVFSDMFTDKPEQLYEALQHLRYNKHEVILFHVMDNQTELAFEFNNRPYKFIDSETGQEMKLFPAQVKELYLKEIQAYTNALKLKCAQYKIEYVPAYVGNDFSQILMSFLIKRNQSLR